VRGDAADFPNDTPVGALAEGQLLDAVVYGTNDGDDADLLNALGQTEQFDEAANGEKDNQSNSRVPDGDGTFSAQAPTPGASNGDGGGGGVDPVARLISEVQGSGAATTLAGERVSITAIVTGDFEDGDADEARNLGGFFLQEEVSDQDGNTATSEGIFVAQGNLPAEVGIGDRVTVTGTVAEQSGRTVIVADAVTVDAVGAVADVSTLAVDVSLDAIDDVVEAGGDYLPDLEAYEGMLVRFTDTLTINEMFQLDRFGEIGLNAQGRPVQFTQENAPDAAAFDAYQREIGSDQIIFDDGLSVQNAPIFAEADLNGDGVFDTDDDFTMGDTIDNLTGVLDYAFNEWRVRSAEDDVNTFDNTNQREESPPDVGGTITVSSFNVLNFFSTLDDAQARNNNPLSAGPNNLEPRGANDFNFDGVGPEPGDLDYVADTREFDRQLEKLVTTLSAIDADVFGLVELENEFGSDRNGDGKVAIDVLVEALNAGYGTDVWASVDPGRAFVDTGDAISVGMIYKTASVTLMPGSVEILDDSDLDGLGFGALDDDGTGVFDGSSTNRAPLLADFQDLATGEVFSVAVTHMKSKGGNGDGGDADQGNGAGAFDALRTEGVQVLTAWLDAEADDDLLVLGDFNAYAKEAPIAAMEDAGYVNLEERFDPGATTFVFDGQTGTLDYAFANSGILDNVTGTAAWEINSPEPDAIDYNLDFGRDAALFDGTTPYRASDHDPLLIGLEFGPTDTPFV
ncbi:MAG: ExeM/NucH family extracellular endonuclease, partial [Jannaschia sp.]